MTDYGDALRRSIPAENINDIVKTLAALEVIPFLSRHGASVKIVDRSTFTPYVEIWWDGEREQWMLDFTVTA